MPMQKVKEKKKFLHNVLYIFVSFMLIVASFITGHYLSPKETITSVEKITETIESQIELPEVVETTIEGDKGDITIESYPKVDSVDGGWFEDITENEAEIEGVYLDKGWSETYNVSSVEAFKNDTLGKCIIANNYYGAQCVSLVRVFWWSYANRDVSTCGTGLAKGMMNCATENAGDDFIILDSNPANIKPGATLVFDGVMTGHTGIALSEARNGRVLLLGENQGGRACDGGGASVNIIDISLSNYIGGYMPKTYIKINPQELPDTSHGF